MRYNFITIEREYGSGGTWIARKLAQECNTPCYGREILEIVSKEQNIAVEEIDRYEETVTNSFLYTFFIISKARSGSAEILTQEGHIFLAEQAVIVRLAAQGPAIFLGHCASEALSSRKGVLRVFIRSNITDKTKRIMEDYDISKEEAEPTMRRYDKKRANYYYANTAKKWSDAENYDLVLDSGKLGIHGCVAALKGLFVRDGTDDI